MPLPTRKARTETDPFVFMNTAIHRELRKALKSVAALEDLTMAEMLHHILCRELNRPDLAKLSPSDF